MKPKGKKTYGAYARNAPAPIRWKIDYDYLPRLPPEAKEWLAKFSDEFYNGSYKVGDSIHPPKYRRELYRAKNSANVDAYEIHRVSGRLVPTGLDDARRELAEAGADAAPTPAHLSSPQYKEAVARYREVCDAVRRDTPGYSERDIALAAKTLKEYQR